MQLRKLGNSGLKVSAIGLGGNTFGGTANPEAATAIIHRALDLGVNFIDTANSYTGGRSEEILGNALAGRRQEIILATKCGWPLASNNPYEGGLSRKWIMQSIDESLRRLKTEYVDLYQAHRPDADTPIDETLRAMDDIVRQGKARYIGCSNYQAWEMTKAHGISTHAGMTPWVSAQNRWNLVDGLDDPTLVRASRDLGVGIIPYTPLASGALTGKYTRGVTPPPGTRAGDMALVRDRMGDAKLAAVERVTPWAEARGHTTTDLAIAWLLAFPEVSTVIVGARAADQLEENLKALGWSLTPEERDEVAALAQNTGG